MDDNRVFTFQVKDPDLDERTIAGRADHDREVVIDVLADRVVHRVLNVLVRDSVLTCWLTNPHLDKIPCLGERRRVGCATNAERRSM